MNRPDFSGHRPDPAQFPKACGCGRSYTPARWDALPLCCNSAAPEGRSPGPDAESPALEWRQCACRSTLAVELQSYAERLASARAVLRHATERLRAHASGCSCGCGAQDEQLADELERLAS